MRISRSTAEKAEKWKRCLAVLLAVGGLALGVTVTVNLPNDTGDGLDPDSVTARTYDLIRNATGIDPSEGYVVLIRPSEPAPPGSLPVEVSRASEVLSAADGVQHVVGPAEDPRLVAPDGDHYLIVAGLGEAPGVDGVAELRSRLAADPILAGRVTLGGPSALNVDTIGSINRDLLIGEAGALLVLVALLLWVFRGWRAAALSVLGGLFTVSAGMGGLALLSWTRPVSGVALNLLTALGLGLSTDFGLLMVTRFREEVAAGATVTDAVDRTVRTAGRTVLFSAATVMAALSATLVYPEPFISSLGCAGMLAACLAGGFALLVFPGMLRAWGPRIAVTGSLRREGFWSRIGSRATTRPRSMVFAAVLILLVLAAPAFAGRLTGSDPVVLPGKLESVQVHQTVGSRFPAVALEPAVVVVHADRADQGAVDAVASQIGAVPGVAGVSAPQWVDAVGWRVDARLTGPSLGDGARASVTNMRALETPVRISVAGVTAGYLDSQDSLLRHLPAALLVILAVMAVVFFLLTGSLILPLKAMLLNLFTAGATAGILVAVHWAAINEGNGGIDVQILVLLAALGLALVTDYGVFVLARVCEYRKAGLPTPVAASRALDRTGRTISAGAAIICVTVAGMSLGDVAAIRQLGIGLIVAVLIDVTLVRAVLVPGLLALLGKANWWAPRFLTRLHRWTGVDDWHGGLTGRRGVRHRVGPRSPTSDEDRETARIVGAGHPE